MDIIKHIIHEERIRKQMYDNHECTALELEGRSFNEKILKLADRIEELEAQLIGAIKQHEADVKELNERLLTISSERGKRVALQAQVESVQWQPIETAPKDGTKILLAKIRPTDGIESLGIAPQPPHIWWAIYGYWSDKWGNWNDGVEPSGLASPTHWMRLSEPSEPLESDDG